MKLAPHLLLVSALSLPWPAAFGQNAKPADPMRTLGGTKAGGGRIMSRDELRACLNREAALKTHRSDYEAQKAALDSERADIKKAADEALALRGAVDAKGVEIKAMNEKITAMSARIEAFNARVAQMKEGKPSAKEREDLAAEEKSIRDESDALNAVRTPLQASYEEAVNAYNSRAAASDERVAAWNARSAQMVERGTAVEDERVAWVGDCANRRYREDDETAIKAGK